MDPIFVICTPHIAPQTSKSIVLNFFCLETPWFFRGHPPYHRAMGAAIGGCQEPAVEKNAAPSYGSCVHPRLVSQASGRRGESASHVFPSHGFFFRGDFRCETFRFRRWVVIDSLKNWWLGRGLEKNHSDFIVG